MKRIEEDFDIVVVGAGHAGCEGHALDLIPLCLQSVWKVLRLCHAILISAAVPRDIW